MGGKYDQAIAIEVDTGNSHTGESKDTSVPAVRLKVS